MENRAKMSRCIKQDCSTYSTFIKLMKRHHEPPVLLYFSGFPGWLAWFSLQILCLNNKIHFSLANANNSASFKRKMVWKWRFLLIHKQQTNLWIKLPTIPPGLAGKIVKKLLALGTNQIAGFEEYSPLTSLEKINYCTSSYSEVPLKHFSGLI